jgi:hypothetical protein
MTLKLQFVKIRESLRLSKILESQTFEPCLLVMLSGMANQLCRQILAKTSHPDLLANI